MKLRMVIAATLAVGLFGAAAFAVGTVNSNIQPKPAAAERGGGSITATYFSRGSNRILTVNDADPTNGTSSYTLTEGQELLVRQLVVSNAYFSAGIAEQGGLGIVLQGEGGGPATALYYPYAAFAAQQFDFNPPLLLRAGDQVAFTYRNVGVPSGYLQAAFHGDAVTGATGFVAR